MDETEPSAAGAADAIACRSCRLSIPAGATVCTRCGAHQTLWGQVAVAVKWAGGAATIVSLLIGMNSLFGLYRGQLERVEAVNEIAAAADRLRDAGDFSRSWQLYEQARELDPASRRVRRGQEELARLWLPNVRIVGDETFTDIVNRTIPILLRGAGRSGESDAADFEALVGWALTLELRERGVASVDIPSVYRRALAMDEDNTLANMFLGHWYASREYDLDRARPHFRVALEDTDQRALVRRFQWSALGNLRSSTRGTERIAVYREQLIVVHRMLSTGEPLEMTGQSPADVAVEVQRAYGDRFDAGNFVAVYDSLTPAQHREVVQATLGHFEPDSSYAYHARFVLALVDERDGRAEVALAELRRLDSLVTSSYVLRVPLDAAIERLSGQPSANALRRRDPLGFHGDELRGAQPGSPEFTRAREAIVRAAGTMREENDLTQVERAIEILSEARSRSGQWLASYSDDPAMEARVGEVRRDHWFLGSELGSLLLASRRLDDAVTLYESARDEPAPSDWERIGAVYNLACAYALRAESRGEANGSRAADIDAGVRSLVEAVTLGYSDWDHIKRDGDLNALRDHPEYKRVMAGR